MNSTKWILMPCLSVFYVGWNRGVISFPAKKNPVWHFDTKSSSAKLAKVEPFWIIGWQVCIALILKTLGDESPMYFPLKLEKIVPNVRIKKKVHIQQKTNYRYSTTLFQSILFHFHINCALFYGYITYCAYVM